MPRPPPAYKTQLLGLAVASTAAVCIAGLFTVATGVGFGEDPEPLIAHFNSVSGLKKNSEVRLSGKNIGRVDEVSFITTNYPCNPDTEDRGRAPERTDECEPWFFCARQPQGDGLCAELLPYVGSKSDYADQGCLVDEQCEDGQVCFSAEFAQRNAGVDWFGPPNSCVSFHTEHHRVEVVMAIQPDKLTFITPESRASVASSGPLGDQQVNITVGTGDSVGSGGRVPSTPTLIEELNRFRARVGVITEKFSGNLKGIAELGGSIKKDDAPPPDLRASLSRYADATNDIVTQEGQLGELFQTQARDEFMVTLHELQKSSDDTRRDVARWRRKLAPSLRDTTKSVNELADGAEAAVDPKSETLGARLVLDERLGLDVSERAASTAESLKNARTGLASVQKDVDELRRQLDAGEGTLGELVRSPSLYYSFVKSIAMFDMFDRNDSIKSGARAVIQAADDWEGADPKLDRASARERTVAPAAAPEAPPPPAPPERRGPPPPPEG